MKKTRRYALPEFLQFAAFVMSFVLAAGAMTALTGCALDDGDEYPLAIPDTTDGDDDVVIEGADVPVTHKTVTDDMIRYCRELHLAHYGRPGCFAVYHNDVWLAEAYQFCQNWAASTPLSCQDEARVWMYWTTRQAWSITLNRYFGDKFRWACGATGWHYLTTPNDTDSMKATYWACDPNHPGVTTDSPLQ